MRRLIAIALVLCATMVANAGSYLIYIKMPDGKVVIHEMPGIPSPDSAGMFKFKLKGGGNVIVHASNVWIEEKSGKGGSPRQK